MFFNFTTLANSTWKIAAHWARQASTGGITNSGIPRIRPFAPSRYQALSPTALAAPRPGSAAAPNYKHLEWTSAKVTVCLFESSVEVVRVMRVRVTSDVFLCHSKSFKHFARGVAHLVFKECMPGHPCPSHTHLEMPIADISSTWEEVIKTNCKMPVRFCTWQKYVIR